MAEHCGNTDIDSRCGDDDCIPRKRYGYRIGTGIGTTLGSSVYGSDLYHSATQNTRALQQPFDSIPCATFGFAVLYTYVLHG